MFITTKTRGLSAGDTVYSVVVIGTVIPQPDPILVLGNFNCDPIFSHTPPVFHHQASCYFIPLALKILSPEDKNQQGLMVYFEIVPQIVCFNDYRKIKNEMQNGL